MCLAGAAVASWSYTQEVACSSYGFRTGGGFQFVDLGDWSNETCFVDLDNCQEGIFH